MAHQNPVGLNQRLHALKWRVEIYARYTSDIFVDGPLRHFVVRIILTRLKSLDSCHLPLYVVTLSNLKGYFLSYHTPVVSI